MNFLSHYYLDHHIDNEHFIVGVCTPDLLSIFNREVRIKARKVEDSNLSIADHSFRLGVIRHFEVDALFHTCPFFYEETHLISEELKMLFGDAARRRFFVAHVLLELLIDKGLIKQNAALVDDFYLHFDKVGIPTIVQMTEDLVHHSLPAYANFLEKFLTNRYLYHYSEAEYITLVLKRLLSRVSISESAYIDTPTFMQFLASYETHLNPKLEALFHFLKVNVTALPDFLK